MLLYRVPNFNEIAQNTEFQETNSKLLCSVCTDVLSIIPNIYSLILTYNNQLYIQHTKNLFTILLDLIDIYKNLIEHEYIKVSYEMNRKKIHKKKVKNYLHEIYILNMKIDIIYYIISNKQFV